MPLHWAEKTGPHKANNMKTTCLDSCFPLCHTCALYSSCITDFPLVIYSCVPALPIHFHSPLSMPFFVKHYPPQVTAVLSILALYPQTQCPSSPLISSLPTMSLSLSVFMSECTGENENEDFLPHYLSSHLPFHFMCPSLPLFISDD